MKNEVEDFNTFGNIAERLKTKVSVRMKWLGDFVFGDEIEESVCGGRGLKWMN